MLTEAKGHASFDDLQKYVGFHLAERGVASGSVGDHILSSIMYDWMHIYVVSLHTILYNLHFLVVFHSYCQFRTSVST